MSKQTVLEIEPELQRRTANYGVSDTRLKKAELQNIMASETLILATAVGEVIVRALERRERNKQLRLLTFMLIGIAGLFGIARYMMQLIQS